MLKLLIPLLMATGGNQGESPWKPWEYLISFRPSISLQEKAFERGESVFHHIEDAYGDVNLDFYSAKVTKLPTIDGDEATAESFLKYIRTHFNDFIDTDYSTFDPYGDEDKVPWTSDSPEGAFIHIDLVGPDNATVICTESKSNYWIFSTAKTEKDGAHPVSGNRQFGFTKSEEGDYIYYTKGADRTTGLLDFAGSTVAFNGADALWKSLQAGIAKFVNNHDGEAKVGDRIWKRHDWGAVKLINFNPKGEWVH